MMDAMFIRSMHGVADSCSLNGGFRLDVANTRSAFAEYLPPTGTWLEGNLAAAEGLVVETLPEERAGECYEELTCGRSTSITSKPKLRSFSFPLVSNAAPVANIAQHISGKGGSYGKQSKKRVVPLSMDRISPGH